jgi:hypothetical protein
VLPAHAPDAAVPGIIEGVAKGYNVDVIRIWSEEIRAFLISASETAAQEWVIVKCWRPVLKV